MPRNGSGTYSLTSTSSIATGQVSDAVQTLAVFTDLASAMTGSIASDGQTPITGNLQMGGNRITGLAPGTAGTNAASVNQIPPLSGANVLAAARNLVGAYASATTVTYTADYIVVVDQTSTTVFLLLSSYNKTADITVSGAGGLDTGAEAANTWYHVWAIAKSDGTQSILLSTSATAPTMPSGYTYKSYQGAVFNNGSSDFNPFKQRGAIVSSQNNSNALTNGTATTFTAMSNFDRQVPSTATAVFGNASVNVTAGTASSAVLLASDAAALGTTPTYGQSNVTNPGGSTGATVGYARCVLTTAQQLKYYVAGANAQATFSVNGWEY